jgi:hypothetical protein
LRLRLGSSEHAETLVSPRVGVEGVPTTRCRSGRAVGVSSSKYKLSRLGDDRLSMTIDSRLDSLVLGSVAGYGSLALRQVANLAKQVGWFGAQPADETDEIEEALDDLEELSETIDSGEDDDEVVDVASDGRLVNELKPKSPTPLKAGFHSIVQRAREDPCACAMAEHMDGLLSPNAAVLTAGVEVTAD